MAKLCQTSETLFKILASLGHVWHVPIHHASYALVPRRVKAVGVSSFNTAHKGFVLLA